MRRFCIRALVLAGLTTAAQAANPVFEAQAAAARRLQSVNRERVSADLKSAGLPAASAVWYAVPAMSDTMRLAWSYPGDGRLNGDLNIVAAQDEFEPASFQLYSFNDKRNVTLTPSALMVALVQTASTAPALLFGLIAGALADLVDRRKVILVTQ